MTDCVEYTHGGLSLGKPWCVSERRVVPWSTVKNMRVNAAMEIYVRDGHCTNINMIFTNVYNYHELCRQLFNKFCVLLYWGVQEEFCKFVTTTLHYKTSSASLFLQNVIPLITDPLKFTSTLKFQTLVSNSNLTTKKIFFIQFGVGKKEN